MKTFHIGIYLNIDRDSGGMYNSSLNMVDALFQIFSGQEEFKFTVFLSSSCRELATRYLAANWTCVFLPGISVKKSWENRIKQLVGFSKMRDFLRWLKYITVKENIDSREIDHTRNRFFKSFSPDLMFFPNCDLEAYQQETPFLTFLPDLQHQLQSEFIEVGDKYVWPLRERHFRNMVKYAAALIVDSEIGREDVLYFYSEFGALQKPIMALPYTLFRELKQLGTTVQDEHIRQKYNLPERYFFYPAQFWQHKNHHRILEALVLLRKRFSMTVAVVFCGSHTGKYRMEQYQQLKQMVVENDLSAQVHFINYVTDAELAYLYSHAVGLVMPTFFGPANIPPIEAWALGCPVIYSNIRGLREQAGDAAWLIDPRSAPDIADAMKGLWESDIIRAKYIAAGKERVKNNSYELYKQCLQQIIITTIQNVKSGG